MVVVDHLDADDIYRSDGCLRKYFPFIFRDMKLTDVEKSEVYAMQNGFPQKTNHAAMWWIDLVGGGIAGAVSRTVTAPVDRIKIHSQVQTRKMNIKQIVKIMYREGALRSFWNGNAVNVAKVVPESGIKFAVYDQVKDIIRNNEARKMSIFERFLAGATAGGIAQTFVYPLDVLKTRLALRKPGQYNGILHAALKIYKNEGFRCFYRGFLPNILGIMPYAGIDLAVYETLKKKLSEERIEKDEDEALLNEVTQDTLPSVFVLIFCGSTSCALGQLVSYPLSLLRTRMQAKVKPISTDFDWPVSSKTIIFRNSLILRKQSFNEDSMIGICRNILNQDGITGFYRGLVPNFLKVLPAVSITYVVYEHTTRLLGKTFF